MHGLIKDRLEEFLRGAPGKKVPVEFEQHLHECGECRGEVAWMQEQSQLLRSLAAPEEIEPPVGFYARVMERIEAQQPVSIWNAFLDPVFGRRLVASSLTVAALLGGYVAFMEADSTRVPSAAEPVMAVQDHPPGLGQDRQRDRDTILVTLASYQE